MGGGRLWSSGVVTFRVTPAVMRTMVSVMIASHWRVEVAAPECGARAIEEGMEETVGKVGARGKEEGERGKETGSEGTGSCRRAYCCCSPYPLSALDPSISLLPLGL